MLFKVYRYNQKRSIDDEDFEEEKEEEFNDNSLISHPRDRRASRNDDYEEIVYEVMEPDRDSYNYSDTNLIPFTRYGYRIKTSTRVG